MRHFTIIVFGWEVGFAYESVVDGPPQYGIGFALRGYGACIFWGRCAVGFGFRPVK